MSWKTQMDKTTTEKIAQYLFDLGATPDNLPEDKLADFQNNVSQALEMRGRVDGPAVMKALMFYGVLRDGLNCDAARTVGDVLKRLTIAHKGGGRIEARDILTRGLQKEDKTPRGTA